MINNALIDPKSIAIIGGTDNIMTPGGKVLKNLIDSRFSGELFVVNLKKNQVQGIKCFDSPNKLPNVELAILAIPAQFCLQAVEILAKQKNTRAFIMLSAGFSEVNKNGGQLEQKIASVVNKVNGCLIGPNCIGFFNSNYYGVFTAPIPRVHRKGVDLVSASGATAVFIMESASSKGLSFASLYSVGNSAQVGVEDVVKYWDETFDQKSCSQVKVVYIESINNPGILLKHASSLVRKGVKIGAWF